MSTVEQSIEAIEDPVVRALATRGQIRSFPKNTVFINEGDRGDSLFVIVTGRVKVYVSDSHGREMILDIHGPGQYVGEMALDGRPRSASVMTLETTACAMVTRDALKDAIVANPDLAVALIEELIDRSRDMISRIFKDLTTGGYVTVVDRQITLNRRPPPRW